MKFRIGLVFFKIRPRQLLKAIFNLDNVHWIAAVLNPRTRMLKMATDAERLYVHVLVRTELEKTVELQQTEVHHSIEAAIATYPSSTTHKKFRSYTAKTEDDNDLCESTNNITIVKYARRDFELYLQFKLTNSSYLKNDKDLVPIPKKGDLIHRANYRIVSLISHTGKILLIVLLNRLKQQLEPHLSEEQAGFRKDRSTVHQIQTLRLIAEKAKRHGKKIYNCFIDFQKAFDTIKHKVIWAVLRSYSIEEKMVTLLQKMYEKAQSAVRIGRHQGEWFRKNVGTRQDNPLSPLLFITYLERAMDHVKESNCGIRLFETLVNNLRFAADIDLIDEDHKSLQEQLEKTRAVAE